jgi:hypothetical protein
MIIALALCTVATGVRSSHRSAARRRPPDAPNILVNPATGPFGVNIMPLTSSNVR